MALAQAQLTAAYLEKKRPGTVCEQVVVETRGDKHRDWSLEKQGGTGLFTAEVEQAVREGRADLAVHSAKDMPSRNPVGMAIAGYLPRASARDVMVVREGVDTPVAIATSSPRRRAQAKKLFPTVVWSTIRGNVETRLGKIARGDADATFLAQAGLSRLRIADYEGVRFEPMMFDDMVPAGGQGAVALQVCERHVGLYQDLFCEQTRHAVEIERRFLARLGVGCHTAFGVHWADDKLWIFHDRFETSMCQSFEATDPIEIDAAIDAIIQAFKLNT